jgi:hypothetical protein
MGMHAGATDWHAKLAEFLDDCVGSTQAEQGARLLEAQDLFASHGTSRAGFDNPEARGALNELIDAGAAVDAALAMIGSATRFMLSRGGSGTCLATMILSEGAEEVMGEAATPALALLAAYAGALLTQAGRDPASASARNAPAGARLH